MALLFSAPAAAAQQAPYAGWQDRPVKALSAEQIRELRAGSGMSLALPAELNGFPGPRHVLDMAEQLALSTDQRNLAEAMFARMQREAAALGERVIEAERRLDNLFAAGDPDPEAVRAAAAGVAALYGKLRFTDLSYHIDMKRLLDPEQVSAYIRLRGYADGTPPQGHGRHGRH